MSLSKIGLALFLLLTCFDVDAEDCCQCKSAAGPFEARVPGGFGAAQCAGACGPSGGKAVGFHAGACGVYHPNPPAPQPNTCPIGTVGGNCKGNNWCACHTGSLQISPSSVVVGDIVTIVVHLGDLSSGKPPTDDPGGAVIEWGDSTPRTGEPYGNGTYTHVYRQAGTYAVTVHQGRDFKWNADDGSCSFKCTADATSSVVVVDKSDTK